MREKYSDPPGLQIRDNHALVTHMFLRSAIKLSTRRHPSLHFSVSTNKKYNERNEIGPIMNEKTGNALKFQGTLPILITRVDKSESDASANPHHTTVHNSMSQAPHAVDSVGFPEEHYQSFVVVSMRGYLNERLPEAITHALAISYVSGYVPYKTTNWVCDNSAKSDKIRF